MSTPVNTHLQAGRFLLLILQIWRMCNVRKMPRLCMCSFKYEFHVQCTRNAQSHLA